MTMVRLVTPEGDPLWIQPGWVACCGVAARQVGPRQIKMEGQTTMLMNSGAALTAKGNPDDVAKCLNMGVDWSGPEDKPRLVGVD